MGRTGGPRDPFSGVSFLGEHVSVHGVGYVGCYWSLVFSQSGMRWCGVKSIFQVLGSSWAAGIENPT